jgi:hypothetical protein
VDKEYTLFAQDSSVGTKAKKRATTLYSLIIRTYRYDAAKKRYFAVLFSFTCGWDATIQNMERLLCPVGRIPLFGYTNLSLVWPHHASTEPCEGVYETHLPTEPAQAGKNPRLSQAYEHGRGAWDHSCAAAPGAQAAGRLTGCIGVRARALARRLSLRGYTVRVRFTGEGFSPSTLYRTLWVDLGWVFLSPRRSGLQ